MDGIDYGWKPEFVAKPAKDAVEKDLTLSTLVLDMENTLGEKFHWEVQPYETGKVVDRPTGNLAFGNKTEVKLLFPVILPG